jgi:amidophosphoribosyltransferase
MVDELKHECAVALVVLKKDGEHYRNKYGSSDYGGTKLSLLLEKQHNRGQDGAGAAILSSHPESGYMPYWAFKSSSSTALADLLDAIGKRHEQSAMSLFDTGSSERIFLGHLRYATFGKNEVAFCHPFIHQASELCHTLLLAGNFNLTNAGELFEDYRRKGEFPTSRADGYLICELIAHELGGARSCATVEGTDAQERVPPLASALSRALKDADGAWTFCGATGDGWAFATRDPHGIRPGYCYSDDEVFVVASERPAIQAAFDVPPEAVKQLPPGAALLISPDGEVLVSELSSSIKPTLRPCAFERIYFSRANDADIYRERKALGAALVPQILDAAHAPMERVFFSYIPNSARIAFYGLLEELFKTKNLPRFGEIAVKDAKFRTFIADAAARREFYKHVYDVTYGLIDKEDTLVVMDDSIVRGNTMRNAIIPMLSRLGPKRIVIVSSAPPIRYPDCYGIDMSTLGELVAFRALVNLLGDGADAELRANPLASLYARFTDEEHCAEIARLLTPPGMKAEVKVVYQTIDALHASCPGSAGDWYFTGDYPTPGGYRVLNKALENYLERKNERSY